MERNAADRLRRTELFVLDMDGTIYLGDRVFPEALAFVSEARRNGRRVLFFTNNASRDPATYVDRLNGMGFSVSRKDIVTSGDVTAAYLNLHHPGEPVYLVGTEALAKQFQEEGIRLSGQAGIVVVSFDLELTYEKLRVAVNLIRNGAIFYSTHPDFV
ncbi:MAG: HAD family hydrolase, partial [Clostridia bacterium]|nr:HAD family hydrolase [Clostridia bacterium]